MYHFITDKVHRRLGLAQLNYCERTFIYSRTKCCDDYICWRIIDGIMVGMCYKCESTIARINPHTDAMELLNEKPHWTDEELMKVG